MRVSGDESVSREARELPKSTRRRYFLSPAEVEEIRDRVRSEGLTPEAAAREYRVTLKAARIAARIPNRQAIDCDRVLTGVYERLGARSGRSMQAAARHVLREAVRSGFAERLLTSETGK